MARLYGRICKLIVAAPIADDYRTVSANVYEIEGLQVRFEVKKTLKKNPNDATIRITNLSPRSQAEMRERGIKVLLQAGYPDNLETLFVGDGYVGDTKTEGPDTVTTIQAGDGARAYLHARVAESFRAGTPASVVVRRLAEASGLDLGNVGAQAAQVAARQYANGYVAFGNATRELDKVLRSMGLEWSIQDGKIQVLRPGEGTTVNAVTLSSETGLIGSPEVGTPEKKGQRPRVKFKSALQPSIKAGGHVLLDGLTHKGLVLVKQVTHVGDTHGDDFYTEAEGETL